MGQQIVQKTDDLREKLKSFTQKKGAGLLLVLGLVGILLIFLSDLIGGNTTAKTEVRATSGVQDSSQYAKELEAQLTDLVGNIQGVGRTRVMLTLEAGTAYDYVADEKSTSSVNAGVNGETSQKSHESEYVLIDGKDGREALVANYTMPEIRGVVVLCEGADDIATVKRVTDAVSVVLGLSTNRICVTKMT